MAGLFPVFSNHTFGMTTLSTTFDNVVIKVGLTGFHVRAHALDSPAAQKWALMSHCSAMRATGKVAGLFRLSCWLALVIAVGTLKRTKTR